MLFLCLGGAFLISTGAAARGADLKAAQERFKSGDYAGCLALTASDSGDRDENEERALLRSKALLAVGRYPEALEVCSNALAQNRWSIRVCWQTREALQRNGQPAAAREMVDRIISMVSRHPGDYQDAPSLVVFGQAALLGGADPKRVLDTLYEAARKSDPTRVEVYLAGGGLALEKHDYALAAKRFQEGLKQAPDDPDLQYGLAQAYAPSDPALMAAALEAALNKNSNHVGSLLLLVDRSIDAEDYTEAGKYLDRIKGINPWEPDAWAYRAVAAHLQNQTNAEAPARQTALKFWATNPRVDHLIGLKLSQNYRFSEGAAHQRQALEFDHDYLPAKAQLAQDLLRLGDEAEGWKLVEQVQKQDGYDVEAFNLAGLHDTMARYATLTNTDFVLRLSRHEAAVYGPRVLELLGRARSNLCAKYGVELKRPTVVEVFAEQKDFAVRTFGMPGNPGYLGVCFGAVVTANSPAAHRGMPVNWEAVLWHEFCHVVTLQMTQNKMPRWLSEGISVYEERQANPAWGEQMNPRYREMVLGEDLTPVSKLSGAFLTPRSALHLQFAYYESSLVVEYLVQRYGPDHLKAILRDLGEGTEINAAIEKHAAPMAKVEEEFGAFARKKALGFGPGLDWEKPAFTQAAAPGRSGRGGRNTPTRPGTNAPRTVVSMEGPAWESWASRHPTNYWVLSRKAQELVEAKKWAEAKEVLVRLTELVPEVTGSESPWRMLAAAHRALGETNGEQQAVARLAELDDTALDAHRRSMELAEESKDWKAVEMNARRYLAVEPLVAVPYRFLARASEETGQSQTGIAAYRALLELEPPDPAETHYQLARLLRQAGDPEAKRQVLQALEEAPRYREALRLLLEIENAEGREGAKGT